MGFEVYYYFSEKVEGQYKEDEQKSFKKRVGDPFEDVPLEKLASSITAQLARRDILISEVEIYELSKKKISFKETKNGIVIKNKKFLFDETESALSCIQVENSEVEEQKPDFGVQNMPNKVTYPHEEIKTKKIIDNVIFSPEPHHVNEIRSKPFRLTVDKKYGVMEKRPAANGIGEMYLVLDDKNGEHWVSDVYFVPATVNLFGDKELGFSSTSPEECKLSWGEANMDSMPNIRRR